MFTRYGSRGSPVELWLFALVASAAAAGAPRGAEAAPRIQGVGEVAIGYTDNAQSAPEVPGGTSRERGVFVLLSPGLVLAVAAPRHVQRLSYTYTYDFFVASSTASTSSNQLAYLGFFDISPRVGLLLGAGAVQSNQHSALVLTPPGAGAVNAVPSGTGSFLSATASELLSYELAVGWRTYESVAVTEQTPLFDTVAPRTFALGGRLGVEYSWETDAVGVEGRTDYTVVTGSVRPDGAPLGEQRQIVGTGLGSWRHDWGRWFTSRAEAGVLRVQRLNTGRGFWAPTGTATLAYVTELGDAEAQYSHTVTTNLLLGQTLLVDEVRLRGGIPLTEKGEVLIGASAGYQRGRIVGDDAHLAARVDAILFDVGVGYQVAEPLLLGLRYQHVEQMSNVRVPTLPVSFVRNSILLGATVRFPPESEMPRTYRAPRRVDRTDEIRGAAVEPAGTPRGLAPRSGT